MSSFGQNLVCTNLTCTTINGDSPSGGSSKWTELAVSKDIERDEGDVIVKNELIAETATINDSLTVKEGTSLLYGKTQLVAKLGSETILVMQGDRSNNSTFIGINTAGVDLSYPESIYLLQMEKKPDRAENGLFRINMKGDIIGCNDLDCTTLQVTSNNITNVNLGGIKETGNVFINLDTADVAPSAVDEVYALQFQKQPVLPTAAQLAG